MVCPACFPFIKRAVFTVVVLLMEKGSLNPGESIDGSDPSVVNRIDSPGFSDVRLIRNPVSIFSWSAWMETIKDPGA